MNIHCPKCSSKRYWSLKDGRFRCAICRKKFSDPRKKIQIRRSTLRTVVQEFLLEHSTNTILMRVNISKYMLLKILTLIRMAVIQDVPQVFQGSVEVGQPYSGGQTDKMQPLVKGINKGSRRGRGKSKQAVFGIRYRSGKVWAELIDDEEVKESWPVIPNQIKKASTVHSDNWKGYTGIAAKGYVHRLVNSIKNTNSDINSKHINGLEGFWGYLKRKLAAKGGVRKERLHLYLGEYVWRYNYRNLNFKEQENRLITIFYQNIRSG